MKRWITMFTIILIGLLSACSADMDQDPMNEPMDISFDETIYYSWNTMTFTNVPEYDILYHTGSPQTDYFIAYQNAASEELTENQQAAYQTTIDAIVILNQTTSFSIAEIETYSSGDFNTYLEDAGIDVSAAMLFTFVTLQQQAEENAYRYVRLTKKEYIELRLERDLTTEEEDALSLLQDYYVELTAIHQSSYLLTQDSFEALIDELTNELNEVLTIEEQDVLETAYNIIQELIE